ncbi:MAG: hypothetical protein OHK0024_09090 [Thalassobaculales bacterium]
MHIEGPCERLEVEACDIAGSHFHDVNLPHAKIINARLAGVVIGDRNVDGMWINGVAAGDLFAADAAQQAGKA